MSNHVLNPPTLRHALCAVVSFCHYQLKNLYRTYRVTDSDSYREINNVLQGFFYENYADLICDILFAALEYFVDPFQLSSLSDFHKELRSVVLQASYISDLRSLGSSSARLLLRVMNLAEHISFAEYFTRDKNACLTSGTHPYIQLAERYTSFVTKNQFLVDSTTRVEGNTLNTGSSAFNMMLQNPSITSQRLGLIFPSALKPRNARLYRLRAGVTRSPSKLGSFQRSTNKYPSCQIDEALHVHSSVFHYDNNVKYSSFFRQVLLDSKFSESKFEESQRNHEISNPHCFLRPALHTINALSDYFMETKRITSCIETDFVVFEYLTPRLLRTVQLLSRFYRFVTQENQSTRKSISNVGRATQILFKFFYEEWGIIHLRIESWSV